MLVGTMYGASVSSRIRRGDEDIEVEEGDIEGTAKRRTSVEVSWFVAKVITPVIPMQRFGKWSRRR